MAAELFNSIADFKQYVGGGVNNSMELASLEATIYDTARRHIVPHLSQAVYDALVTAHAGSSMNAAQTALLPFVRRPLAKLTMYEYLPIGSIQVGESGPYRIETESHKAAFRYQEKQYSMKMLSEGYNAIETMLGFLTGSASTYTDWANSVEGKAHRELLVGYASQFRQAGQPECDRYTYTTLIPLITDVQYLSIQKILPKLYWNYLINPATVLTAYDKQLLIYIRKSIVMRTVSEAIALQQVKVENGRIVVYEEYGEQSQVNRTVPQASLSAATSSKAALWSDRLTLIWRDYINENATQFPLIYDIASGGTNATSDAWHIDTADELAAKEIEADDVGNSAIIRF